MLIYWCNHRNADFSMIKLVFTYFSVVNKLSWMVSFFEQFVLVLLIHTSQFCTFYKKNSTLQICSRLQDMYSLSVDNFNAYTHK